MDSTLTIRLDGKQRAQLKQSAAKLGKTESEWVRQVIKRSLDKSSLGRRIGHLRGSLDEAGTGNDSFSKSLRARNWRS
jgi:hypothetical protein